MSKAANTPQALRLLAYSLTGIGAFFIVLHLLLTYVLGSPGMVTVVLVVVMCAIWFVQRSQQFRARNEQEALLMQHRAFAAEVERAWERSHAHEAERRKGPAPSHAPSAQPAAAESTAAKKRRKKKAREDGEETFIVDDELEAEVVEDLEDFLQHSRLRQALKKTADDLRESQKRKEDKKALPPAPVTEAPEPKKAAAKAPADPGKAAASAGRNGSAAKAAPKALGPRPAAKDAGKTSRGKANGATTVNGHSAVGKGTSLPSGKGPAASAGKGWKSPEAAKAAKEKDSGDTKESTKPLKGHGKSKSKNWQDEWYGGHDSWWGEQESWEDGWYGNGGGSWWGQGQRGHWNGSGRASGTKRWAPRGTSGTSVPSGGWEQKPPAEGA